MNLTWLNTTTIATTAACVVVTTIYLRYLYKAHRMRHIPGPQPSNFFLGNVLDTLGSVATWKTTGTYPEPFLSWIKAYGGAVLYREFFTNVVMISDPKALQYVLVTHANNFRRDPALESYVTDMMFGAGLLATHGKQHDEYRALLNPIVASSSIKAFVPTMDDHVRCYCATMLTKAASTNSPVDMFEVVQQLTLEVIGMAAFGFNFKHHPEAHAAYKAYQLEPSPFFLIGIFTIPGFLNLPLPEVLRRRTTQKALKQVINAVIEDKLKRPAADGGPKDILDLILPHSTTPEALCHTMTFLFAGHETSASALAWVFASVASRPDIVAQIRQEYHAVVSKHKSLASWEAASDLKYTLAVIHETLRLNPVVYEVLPRVALVDDILPMEEADGRTLDIPQGTKITINLPAIHRNPKYWANPEAFIPDRFVDGSDAHRADRALRGDKPSTFYYLPFSMGGKNCIGQRFALVEMQLIVATFLAHFDFALTDRANICHNYAATTLHPVKLEMSVRSVASPATVERATLFPSSQHTTTA
ncbi:Aste57867_16984 [Aphanomyces stellatus]|uniref:Aste57867_16984 protein n=1 Tax=Aphanomyces stellatus TaxID=120398 RepID=A0A485L6Q8_9STRA|nr:hypothetical protein As57867_016926 [Aphanomyces stellatus]VFT93745.1 Aste57867_16984 [Aphanomyces stellatus]